MPALGTAGGFGGWRDDTTVFYTFTSFTFPSTIFKYGDRLRYLRGFSASPRSKFNPRITRPSRVFYESKDAPRFDVHRHTRRAWPWNGANPCYLEPPMAASTSASRPGFNSAPHPPARTGRRLREPNLRGGGEYGETWHKAGHAGQEAKTSSTIFIAAGRSTWSRKNTPPAPS